MATRNQNDHDLLIELRTEMAEVRKDIKNLGDNLVGRVTELEQKKADKIEVDKLIDSSMKTLRDEQGRLGKIVYGACGLILVAFLASLIALIYK